MVARIAADARHNRHERGQRDDLGNGGFERADNAAGHEGGKQIDGQPNPAVFHRIPHGSEQVFLFAQTGHVPHVGFAFFADHVHHFVHRQPADEFVVFIDHGRGHQVVTLKRAGGIFDIVVRVEGDDVARHQAAHFGFGVGNQQFADGQHALQNVVFVHHEDFVGVVRQPVEAAQVAQHDFAGNVGADADGFKVHDSADLVVVVRHGSLHLGAFFFVAVFQHFADHVGRQIVRQIGQIVRVHVFHGRHEFLRVHAFDKAFAHGVGHFQQYVAVFFGNGEFPHQNAFFGRQVFQYGGHVCRVQFVQDADQHLQLRVDSRLFQRVFGGDEVVKRQQL